MNGYNEGLPPWTMRLLGRHCYCRRAWPSGKDGDHGARRWVLMCHQDKAGASWWRVGCWCQGNRMTRCG